MFVQAPYQHGNGVITTSQQAVARAGGDGYMSVEEAISHAFNYNQFQSIPLGLSSKGGESGIIGYKQYVNTAYTAQYKSFKLDGGRVVTVHQEGGLHYSTNDFVGLGYLGFHGSGFDEYLTDLTPWASSLSLQGLATRVVLDNLLKRSVVECLLKARQERLDLAETLTGIPQTVGMIAQRVLQVVNAWRAVRTGNWYGALSALGVNRRRLPSAFRDSQSWWLELQYGWLPLLSDIYQGIDLIEELLNAEPVKPHSVVVRRLETGGLSMRGVSPSGTEWADWGETQESTGLVETKFKFRINDASLNYLSSLNLLNPLYIGWVALPFSFVIDWLVPIGPWLEAMTASIGLDFISGYSTVKTYGRVTVAASSRTSGVYPKEYEDGKSSATAEQLCVQRIPYLGWPFPQPYVRFPFTSDKRVANAVALLGATKKWR